jgi:hypothetical protein
VTGRQSNSSCVLNPMLNFIFLQSSKLGKKFINMFLQRTVGFINPKEIDEELWQNSPSCTRMHYPLGCLRITVMTTSCSAALPMRFVKSLQAFPNSKARCSWDRSGGSTHYHRPPSPTRISKHSEYKLSDFLTCTENHHASQIHMCKFILNVEDVVVFF